MRTALEVAVERLLDRAVARAALESPRARELLSRLQGRRLAIRVEGTPLRVLIESTGRSLKLLPGFDAAPDAGISAAPLSLLLLSGSEPRAQAAIRRGDVRIDGDAEIAQRFRALARLLQPDLEAGLGRLLGRSPAHLAVRGLRSAARWARSAADTSLRDLADYLAHETGDLVSRAEAEHFLRGVDRLREDCDRLEARLALAERRANALTGAPR